MTSISDNSNENNASPQKKKLQVERGLPIVIGLLIMIGWMIMNLSLMVNKWAEVDFYSDQITEMYDQAEVDIENIEEQLEQLLVMIPEVVMIDRYVECATVQKTIKVPDYDPTSKALYTDVVETKLTSVVDAYPSFLSFPSKTFFSSKSMRLTLKENPGVIANLVKKNFAVKQRLQFLAYTILNNEHVMT